MFSLGLTNRSGVEVKTYVKGGIRVQDVGWRGFSVRGDGPFSKGKEKRPTLGRVVSFLTNEVLLTELWVGGPLRTSWDM